MCSRTGYVLEHGANVYTTCLSPPSSPGPGISGQTQAGSALNLEAAGKTFTAVRVIHQLTYWQVTQHPLAIQQRARLAENRSFSPSPWPYSKHPSSNTVGTILSSLKLKVGRSLCRRKFRMIWVSRPFIR